MSSLALPALAEEAAGVWHGKLMGKLNIVIRIETDGTAYKGVLESPDQANFKMPLDSVTATADSLDFTAVKINGRYQGKWDEAQKAWVGTWTQGQGLPLTLKRIDADQANGFAPKRPQVEAAEAALANYHVEAVTLPGAVAGVTLSGTYSAPRGKGPFPTVILIAGSGPNTRDEAVAGHKVFLVWADALNKAGIAVLRYDKRGVGASTGDYKAATTADFAADAGAAVTWLKARKDVGAIGLVGHSEGGIIAPIVANREPAVRFIVLMAGGGVRGDQILITQQTLIGRANGMTEDNLAQVAAANRRIYDALISNPVDTEARVRAVVETELPLSTDPKVVDSVVKPLVAPWMKYFIAYDPAPELRKVRVPVLALIGGKDLQVAASDNLPAMTAALKGNKSATVRELPGLNHLFQSTAGSGAPSEYSQIEETTAPAALDLVTTWIRARVQ
nr:alpha/beta hydrolase [Asticcacaulis aquaticus]